MLTPIAHERNDAALLVGNLGSSKQISQQKKDTDNELTCVENPTFDMSLVGGYQISKSKTFVTRSRNRRFGFCLPQSLMDLPCALLTISRASVTLSVSGLLIMSRRVF